MPVEDHLRRRRRPQRLRPLGGFFGLGRAILNAYQSLLFTASTNSNNELKSGCAFNAYVRMPFPEGVRVELVNEIEEQHRQYFYVDWETCPDGLPADTWYFHAEFRRENPFCGWGREIRVNGPEANIVNKGREAWDNNYVILDAEGSGHYIGCDISVTKFQV